MTNLVDRPITSRGHQARVRLVAAGLALLAEGGWEAVTTRAVATRAESNPGLIHYHFGGLPGLRMAIAESASEEAIGPITDMFLGSHDFATAFASLSSSITTLVADDRRVRLATELVAGAGHDPDLGAAFRQKLIDARAALSGWVSDQRPQWSAERVTGVAALIAAVLDGLLLHRAMDESAPVHEALNALGIWVHETSS